ncbi:hypothetical protein HanXRQr2_Chr16g0731651 [Helianthus annuus]|uniref:Uncharacterized protein n=1 Tax=Helianthus annuus TaxID=4232 RepID=A0A9K3GX05_HELAN|nr:hypothetical protein HanXRQr2_Chr16g0731651 [Helianthus annuus]
MCWIKNMVNLPNLTRKGAFKPKGCAFVNHLMITIGIPSLSLVNNDNSQRVWLREASRRAKVALWLLVEYHPFHW